MVVVGMASSRRVLGRAAPPVGGGGGDAAAASGLVRLRTPQEEKQVAVLGLNTSWEHVSAELRDLVRRQEAQLGWTLGLLRVLLSCTFLLVLHA